MATVQSSSMFDRMIRAAKLDVNVFEEAEHNRGLQQEAITVVAIVSALSSIGQYIAQRNVYGDLGIFNLVLLFVSQLVGFFIWAGIAYIVGTRIFGGTADYGEMIRTMGYAYSPQALAILAIIPVIGGLIGLAAGIWALVAGVIAIRQALDFDTGKAVLTVVVGFLAYMAFTVLVVATVVGAGL